MQTGSAGRGAVGDSLAHADSSGNSVNLDLLRSLAVLMVLGVHLLLYFQVPRLGPLPLLGMGQWGVLIFFFHTSLVLMRSLARMSQRSEGRPSFSAFMLRRCFRLLPLCWLVVTIVVATGAPVAHLKNSSFTSAALGGGALLDNLLLIQNLTGSESVIATLWSLPYEMQMYLLLPGLFGFARAARTRNVLGAWLATALLAAGWRFEGGEAVRDALWLVPCFFGGIVAFKLSAHVRPTWPAICWPALLTCLTLIYLFLPKPSVGALGCLAIGICQPHMRELELRPLRTASQWIARYSYGAYLTHLICIWWAFDSLRDLSLPLRWILFLTSTAGLPIVLYHGLEQPMVVLGGQLASKLHRSGTRVAALSR